MRTGTTVSPGAAAGGLSTPVIGAQNRPTRPKIQILSPRPIEKRLLTCENAVRGPLPCRLLGITGAFLRSRSDHLWPHTWPASTAARPFHAAPAGLAGAFIQKPVVPVRVQGRGNAAG
jgi:hypothetical protein